MADLMSAAERSERMSRIRSQNTKPELMVRKFLHHQGFRYLLHVKGLSGRPDLVLPKYRTVIFVDGCFWHGHSCQGGRVPATNTSFWKEKISANKGRDRRNRRALKKDGWRVVQIWECQLSTKTRRDNALARLASRITSGAGD